MNDLQIMLITSTGKSWRHKRMNDTQKKVWEVAKSHHLTEVLDYYCDDFEAFCDRLKDADDALIICSIMSLIFNFI